MANQVKPCLDHPSFLGHWAPNPATERGNNFHIGVHPKEPKIIYPSGKFIVVRDLEDPSSCFVYRGHNVKTTVAKFSPNGFWVASADIAGKVRVWSWDNPEHALKIEIHGISGAIKDLAWDSEGKRIVVAGDGTGSNMRAFAWDTGNNLGEMIGHNKRVLTCDYRPARPFKIMTGSEDMRTVFFKGPPFSLEHSNADQHSNFINCVRFSPDGGAAATGGSDYRVWLYDGATGKPAKELVAPGATTAHTGSVYALGWSPDGFKLITASADKTCRLWDVASGALEHTWGFADDPQVPEMQCAAGWSPVGNGGGGRVVSVSVDGNINLLQPGSERPAKVVQAHQVAITAMCPNPVGPSELLVTGSFDGVVISWDPATGVGRRAEGQIKGSECGAAHGNKVVGVASCASGVVSVAWDDCLRLATVSGARLSYVASLATMAQPKGVAANPGSDLVAVATATGVMLCRGASSVLSSLETNYVASSVALLGEEEVAVGGSDNKIHIYAISGGRLSEVKVIEGHRGEVCCLAYSPDGTHLAAGDALRECNVWIRGTWEAAVQGLWQFHTTRINCLAWAPCGRLVATGGQDENIFVWSLDKPRKRIHYPFAHKDGVTGLAWLSDDVLASAGSDHCVARWDVAKDKSKLA